MVPDDFAPSPKIQLTVVAVPPVILASKATGSVAVAKTVVVSTRKETVWLCKSKYAPPAADPMRMTTIAMMIHFRRDDVRGAGETGGSETGTGDADMGPCAKVPPPDECRPLAFPYSKVLAHRPEGPALSYQSGHRGKGFNVAFPCGSHGGEEAQVGPQEGGQEEGVLLGTQGTKGEEAVSR